VVVCSLFISEECGLLLMVCGNMMSVSVEIIC
jgi:hypothetical protein